MSGHGIPCARGARSAHATHVPVTLLTFSSLPLLIILAFIKPEKLLEAAKNSKFRKCTRSVAANLAVRTVADK